MFNQTLIFCNNMLGHLTNYIPCLAFISNKLAKPPLAPQIKRGLTGFSLFTSPASLFLVRVFSRIPSDWVWDLQPARPKKHILGLDIHLVGKKEESFHHDLSIVLNQSPISTNKGFHQVITSHPVAQLQLFCYASSSRIRLSKASQVFSKRKLLRCSQWACRNSFYQPSFELPTLAIQATSSFAFKSPELG